MSQELLNGLESSLLVVFFTDEQIIKLAKLKWLREQGLLTDDTIEYKRMLYLEYIYQSGRIAG